MKNYVFRIGLFIFAALVVLGLAFGLVKQKAEGDLGNGQTLQLQAPSFVQEVQAQNEPEDFSIGAYLDQEAGISAYFKSPFAINLSTVRGSYRTIETETADYIIGSVPVTNYTEHFDAHVYVHKDGWILAYYLKADPTSKIADVKGKTVIQPT